MKRILIIIAFLTAAICGHAQNDSYFYSKGVSLDWGIGGHVLGEASAETTLGLGVRFGKGWMMSVGAGYAGCSFPNTDRLNNFTLAYIDGKYSFKDKRVSPYVGLRIKGEYLIGPDTGKLIVLPDTDRYTDSKQLFIIPQAGIDIRKTSIWLGIGAHFAWETEHHKGESYYNGISTEITHEKDIDRQHLIPCLAIGATFRL